jgi:hypothetical protein
MVNAALLQQGVNVQPGLLLVLVLVVAVVVTITVIPSLGLLVGLVHL